MRQEQPQQTAPIIVRAGKVAEKELDDLRANTGKLVEDVNEVLRLVQADAGVAIDRRVFVPVIVIYSRNET